MKTLLKIFLLCSLLLSSIFANTQNINEYKSDLYYANGIMIGETEGVAKEIWRDEVKKILLKNTESIKNIGKIDISYNASENLFNDLFEAFQQSGNEQGWLTFSQYIPTYYGNNIPDSVDTHRPDLITQINAYKESIKLGHSVIIIAHSQGNYYTNEAYEELDEWMKPYFHMMGVATPADHVAGFSVGDITAPYVTFHNDIINLVVSGLNSNRHNPNTEHDPILSYDAHDFYDSYMTAGNTKTEIQNFILDKIDTHKNAPSQWKVENKLRENTEDYKVTLTHKYDTSITSMQGVEVYPFNLDKKLYHVTDNTGGNGWVMASFGGEEVFNSWDDKKDDEAYLINNQFNEKIHYNIYSSEPLCPYQSLFVSTFDEVHHQNQTFVIFSISSNIDGYTPMVTLSAGTLLGPSISNNIFFEYEVIAYFDKYTYNQEITMTVTVNSDACTLTKSVTMITRK